MRDLALIVLRNLNKKLIKKGIEPLLTPKDLERAEIKSLISIIQERAEKKDGELHLVKKRQDAHYQEGILIGRTLTPEYQELKKEADKRYEKIQQQESEIRYEVTSTTCSLCGGNGTVEESMTISTNCPHCGGSGIVISTTPGCSCCGGGGDISPSDVNGLVMYCTCRREETCNCRGQLTMTETTINKTCPQCNGEGKESRYIESESALEKIKKEKSAIKFPPAEYIYCYAKIKS